MRHIHLRWRQPALRPATLLATACLLLTTAAFSAELPPRPFLGVSPMAVDLSADADSQAEGATLGAVSPGGTAEALGLKPGDRILAVNEAPVADFTGLIEAVASLPVGASLSLVVDRAGDTLEPSGSMLARPRERSESFEVIYSAVDVGTPAEPSRVRNIIYRPFGATAEAPQPAVFHIQGYTCASIDYALLPELTLNQILVTLAEAGYVVYKQEKPGVGDSQGPDCADIDFDTELAAFSAGLAALRSLPYVDAGQLHIFGHSLGGVQAPLLARSHPIKSIIAYGATVASWRDYLLDIYSKQALILGTSEEQATQNRATVQPLIDGWLASDRPWHDLVSDPEIKPALSSGLVPVEGDRVFGRNYRFFRGLNQYDLPTVWRSIDSHALALHGSLDIQAIDASWTEALVGIVNDPPDRIAEAVILDNAEHAFLVFDSRAEQLAALGDGSYSPAQPGERYDARAAEAMRAWLNRFSPPTNAPAH